MAEYKKEIGAAVAAAIVLALVASSIAYYYFPLSNTSSSSTGNTAGETSSQAATYTFTTTVPSAQTYSNSTVSFDSRLAVSTLGNLQSSTNATAIAQALAAKLEEIPLRPLSEINSSCSISLQCTNSTYLFQTSLSSSIAVTLINGRFFELRYIVQNYSALHDSYWNSHPSGGPPSASADGFVSNLTREAFALDLSQVAVNDSNSGPGWMDWVQEFNGLQITNSGQVYFEEYPPTSAIIKLTIIQNAGWHSIPSDFPLDTPVATALASAKQYALSNLHLTSITNAKISLQLLQDHLYYAVTVSDQSRTYVLFVNPINGEIGLPE